ncbi:MAG: LysM peptidoglycan-binding domain-containing protein [Proteobacteria bacterium]|nr:LysM peptidoglycan-binding domain-containing protein [Pseudomonadota bacterium]
MNRACRMLMCAMMLTLAGGVDAYAQSQADQGGAAASEGGSSQRIGRVAGQNTSLMSGNFTGPAHSDAKRTHTVVDGDTLWDLSAEYLSDPMMWPALWSYNPQVTNPHWIYPGDTIYLEPKSEEAAALTTYEEEIPAAPTFVRSGTKVRGTINVPGIYLTELPETRGHILFSDQQKYMLAPLDEVQIDFVDIEQRKKVRQGTRYTVFEEAEPVEFTEGDLELHKLVRVGMIKVIDPHANTLSTARIIQGTREIERGNMIIPNSDLVFTVQRRPNKKSLEGRIIDTIDPISQISADQFVIINRGLEDGVEAGNRFVIFEQREGLDRLEYGESETQYAADERKKNNKDDEEEEDPRDSKVKRGGSHSWVLGYETRAPEFPERDDLSDIYGDRDYTTADLPLRKIGEVLVIDAKDKFCTGMVMNSAHEVIVDTRVVLIRGL